MSACLVIGVGNPYRGDDCAGLEVARRLRRRALPGVQIRECSGSGLDLLDAWRGASRVVVVDAARGRGRAGTVRRLDAHRQPLPAWLRAASTHAPGVGEAVELARRLGELPRELVVYAIEARRFGFGTVPSPAVKRAISRSEARLARELRALTEPFNGPDCPWGRRDRGPGRPRSPRGCRLRAA